MCAAITPLDGASPVSVSIEASRAVVSGLVGTLVACHTIPYSDPTAASDWTAICCIVCIVLTMLPERA